MSTFQVDLRGMVDLLSRNLYSGPRVYVRELLQNCVDAISARRELNPQAPARISFTIEGNTLTCADTGIGLTEQEAGTLLSTIGASSKRDELGLARSDFLGQFGIGLLSCFMVSPEIDVRSRSAKDPNAPTVHWQGHTDGTYSVDVLDAVDPGVLRQSGTVITLHALPGEVWMEPDTVRSLIDEFGSLLPVEIEVRSQGRTTHHGNAKAPWELPREQQVRWCRENLGFNPSEILEIEIPGSGLHGLVAINPDGVSTNDSRHTVYVKRMLVSRSAQGLAPKWAYFARVVADADYLRLTASREQLADDDLLHDTANAVGTGIRTWLERLAKHAPGTFNEFVASHAVGLRSVALTDDYMLDLVSKYVPYQTTLGPRTLVELAEMDKPVRYTRSVDQYRALADVAASQELVLVNAGYAYEDEVLGAFMRNQTVSGKSVNISLVDPGDLLDAFQNASPAEEAEALDLMLVAARAINPADCEVVLRRFEPATMPALYLPDPDLAERQVAKTARENADSIWQELLGVTDPFANSRPPRLVLNRANSLVARLVAVGSNEKIASQVLRGLYVQCLLAGRQPLGPKERAWAAQALGALLDMALQG